MPQKGLLIDWTQLEERIPELEDMITETSKTENQREKMIGKKSGQNKPMMVVLCSVGKSCLTLL